MVKSYIVSSFLLVLLYKRKYRGKNTLYDRCPCRGTCHCYGRSILYRHDKEGLSNI